MNYFLIKSINCIVSDAEIKEGDKYAFSTSDKTLWFTGASAIKIPKDSECFKIEYSNNLEGLKPFELVDEVEELAKHESKEIFGNDFSLAALSYQTVFIAGYKSKAGYTEKQTTGFTEWVTLNYRVHDRLGGILYYFPIVTEKFNHQMFSAKELLTLYLQEQESKLIEVIQISEHTFKIKKQ